MGKYAFLQSVSRNERTFQRPPRRLGDLSSFPDEQLLASSWLQSLSVLARR